MGQQILALGCPCCPSAPQAEPPLCFVCPLPTLSVPRSFWNRLLFHPAVLPGVGRWGLPTLGCSVGSPGARGSSQSNCRFQGSQAP